MRWLQVSNETTLVNLHALHQGHEFGKPKYDSTIFSIINCSCAFRTLKR